MINKTIVTNAKKVTVLYRNREVMNLEVMNLEVMNLEATDLEATGEKRVKPKNNHFFNVWHELSVM